MGGVSSPGCVKLRGIRLVSAYRAAGTGPMRAPRQMLARLDPADVDLSVCADMGTSHGAAIRADRLTTGLRQATTGYGTTGARST